MRNVRRDAATGGVIARRKPSQSLEVDLLCNGVQLTGWLPQVQRWDYCAGVPLNRGVAQGVHPWLEHLSIVPGGGSG